MGIIRQYTKWLHTRWPAGRVEKLPVVNDDGSTNVAGLYVVGDLTGVPLLKFSSDTGARAVQTIASEASFGSRDTSDSNVLDLVIVGGGVSGFAAALEAKKRGLTFELFEATEPYSTIVNFPKGKPIFTYPTDMTPSGDLQFHEKSAVKEGLLEDLREQTVEQGIEPTHRRVEQVRRRGSRFEIEFRDGEPIHAHRVIVGIGRSGNFRKLGVPGEELDKVYNRLHDPKDFCGLDVLIVGGGDSALETAIALATCGCRVTVSYRKPEFSRPKPENIERIEMLQADPASDVAVEDPVSERVTTAAGSFMGKHHKPGSIRLALPSTVASIRDDEVTLKHENGDEEAIRNDAVFAMIGREPPLDFFRRSGVQITGELTKAAWAALVMFALFCVWLYHWKSGKLDGTALDWKPAELWNGIAGLNDTFRAWANDPTSLFATLKTSASGRSFYYTLAYCLCVGIFGIRRIRRRKTPYVTRQTLTLIAIQWLPLFLLPELILPYLGHQGAFDAGVGKTVADSLFPAVNYDHGREYWRAYGFILAWPLFVYNFFTSDPLWGWLIIGSIQTFVIIPLIIRKWGKGAYCGWICSCGALAETMGDTHRHKMPHGPLWNRVNMLGQVFLAFAVLIMGFRILGWIWPDGFAAETYRVLFEGPSSNQVAGLEEDGLGVVAFFWQGANYKWFVDLLFAGIVGVAFYFWFSGRVWCRFACPLAALMHIYTRFSRFRIVPEKKKCISCNVCTSVCHQGIDIMNFANKGLPMEDPECVRCSACVQSCPTGVLRFGEVDPSTNEVIRLDRIPASLVHIAEARDRANASRTGD